MDRELIKPKTEKEIWQRKINIIMKKLEKSGLWQDMLEELRIVEKIGYEKLQEAERVFKEKVFKEKANEREIHEKIREINPLLIGTGEEGEYVNTNFFFWADIPKIKKMYFGKYKNEEVLKKIKEALNKKEEIYICVEAKYDIEFKYNPKTNEAFYNELYRRCWNGHFYAAISETHALFIEDD